MVCIYCGYKAGVINSRHLKNTNRVWRRRKCLKCKNIFTTREYLDPLGYLVVLDDQKTEPFCRERLFLSIYNSLRHRDNPLEDSIALADTVWSKLMNKITSGSLPKNELAEITYQTILNFDNAGAVHYLAFHKINNT